MLKEADIIKRVTAASKNFIGDDAAVLPSFEGGQCVITKDLLIEDIHFRTKYFTPYHLAHKALHVNLSDLAAMAAKPRYIMCGIAIPKTLDIYANEFINQLLIACSKENVTLIGGDTTASPDKLTISITAIGLAPATQLKYRHHAKEGELICVAGNLGYAHIGFKALEQGCLVPQQFVDAFLLPNAKIKEGQWLGHSQYAGSMMDISDGLFIDLKRMSESSSLGAEIEIDKFIFSPEYLNTCLKLKLDPVKIALTGGEDYGLLFTVAKANYHKLAKEFLQQFNYEIKVVGQITINREVILLENKKFKNLNLQPFTHFGEEI